MRRLLTGLAAGFLLAACASRIAKVDHQVILQPGEVRHELASLELFVMPMELDAPPPGFPAGYTEGDLAPLVVCVEVWLDANGDPTHVEALQQEPECLPRKDARTRAFEEAVVDRLGHWHWTPARICRFPEHLRAQMERGDCTGREVDIDKVPVRLAYAFTFQRTGGRASVGSARR